MPGRLGERGHETRLTHAGRTLEEDGFGKLHRAEKTSGVTTRRRRREFETQRRTSDDGRGAAGNGEGGNPEETVAIDEFGVAGIGRRLDRRVCLQIARGDRVSRSRGDDGNERRFRGVRVASRAVFGFESHLASRVSGVRRVGSGRVPGAVLLSSGSSCGMLSIMYICNLPGTTSIIASRERTG